MAPAAPAPRWLDFTYGGHGFTVNDQFGEYWFFVDDASAPEDLLCGLVEYCQRLLGEPAV